MNNALRFLVAFSCLGFAADRACAEDPVARYDKVRKIAIGGDGGWDFIEVDSSNDRLYVTRGSRVVVVNLVDEKVVGEIAPTPGVHGIAFVPDIHRGFTSNGGDSTATVFDSQTLKTLGKVKANGRPDIIYFEPVSRRVFTFNHGTNDATAIDPDKMEALGNLALGGVPELAVSDDNGHVFVNLEDTGEIVEFDARSLKILKRFSLAPGEEPTGLAFDAQKRKLFSTCANKKLVVADADLGKVVQTLEIGPGPDGCVRDPKTGLIFASCGGDGTLAIIGESSQGTYEVKKTVKTQVSAKTLALDPKTHRIYLSAATVDTAPAAKEKAGRRRYAPGSFVVIVVGG